MHTPPHERARSWPAGIAGGGDDDLLRACQLTATHRSIFSGDRPAAARAVGRPAAAQSAT